MRRLRYIRGVKTCKFSRAHGAPPYSIIRVMITVNYYMWKRRRFRELGINFKGASVGTRNHTLCSTRILLALITTFIGLMESKRGPTATCINIRDRSDQQRVILKHPQPYPASFILFLSPGHH